MNRPLSKIYDLSDGDKELSFYAPVALIIQLNEFVIRNDMTRSQFLRSALRKALAEVASSDESK